VVKASQQKAAKKAPKKNTVPTKTPPFPARRSSRLHKKAADMQEQKKSAVAEVWAELVDANESPQGDPWTSSYCGHHNPDDEQRCAMERITSELHAPPTSGTGAASRSLPHLHHSMPS
jgi:hypothetical protein